MTLPLNLSDETLPDLTIVLDLPEEAVDTAVVVVLARDVVPHDPLNPGVLDFLPVQIQTTS